MRININNKMAFENAIKKIHSDFILNQANGLTIDSRKVNPGDIFLALKGENVDGHDFIEQAANAGASMAIVEKDVGDYLSVLRVDSTYKFLFDMATEYRNNLPAIFIGITGTNGKTTTKEMLQHVLSSTMKVVATKGNFNSTIGVPLSFFEFDIESDIAIIEMGASKPGEIGHICNIAKPHFGLITNIYAAHLECFGEIEEVAKTKSALFTSLPAEGMAFINLDDPFISKMEIPCNNINFSFKYDAKYKGKWVNTDKQHLLHINEQNVGLSRSTSPFGMNALSVYSIASYMGLDHDLIARQIKSFKIPKGRGNKLLIKGITVINDSYNANLESAKSGIINLINISGNGRKIAVIGDMLELGIKEEEYHHTLGKILSNNAVDAVFAYGNLTQHTIRAMNGTAVFHQFYNDKTKLISDLKEFIKEGDHIYIKGSRGMKMEDVLIGLKI